MKTSIHPKTYLATATCASCNNTFKTLSTKEVLHTEICSMCHPFYTGKEKLIDTAGKVEKFKARRVKAAAVPKLTKKPRVKKQVSAKKK